MRCLDFWLCSAPRPMLLLGCIKLLLGYLLHHTICMYHVDRLDCFQLWLPASTHSVGDTLVLILISSTRAAEILELKQ